MAKHRTKKYFDDEGNLILKPYRLKDLAMIFDINASTMKKWIDKHKEQLGEKKRFLLYYQPG
ncbi:MAG: hypothetical protein WDO71_08900 [Bacteroidota bacterium]